MVEVWKTIFDGIVGATIGALVAMIVLKRTLREQQAGLSTQIQQQDVALRLQLESDKRSLDEQMHSASQENMRQRITDATADYLAALEELRSCRPDGDRFGSIHGRLGVAAERLRIDLSPDDEMLYWNLRKWRRHLGSYAHDVDPTLLDGSGFGRSHSELRAEDEKRRHTTWRAFQTKITFLEMSIVTWIKSDAASRGKALEVIFKAGQLAFHATPEAWLEYYEKNQDPHDRY